MLVYRLPREPSTPRIALWRRLRQLGAVRPVDDVAMLPQTARTEEQLEWLAAGIVEAGGEASVWISRSTTSEASAQLLERASAERAAEYEALVVEAHEVSSSAGAMRARAVARLRGQLEQVRQRDFTAPPARERAVQAIEALATEGPQGQPASPYRRGRIAAATEEP
jgi:HPt (histidine-containing phosphotransfer) domain-containing protein